MFLYIFRKPILPIESEIIYNVDADDEICDNICVDGCSDDEVEHIELFSKHMTELRESMFEKAHSNIQDAQARQKKDYDSRHHKKVRK